MHGTSVLFASGARITITGITVWGPDGPAVGNSVFRENGRGVLPEPQAVDLKKLNAGAGDSLLIETSGVLRRTHKFADYRIAFRLVDGSTSVLVVVPKPDNQFIDGLIDAKVHVRGVGGWEMEGGRRVGAQIFVTRTEDIVADEPKRLKSFDLPGTPARSLPALDLNSRFLHQIRISGRVIYRTPKLLFVEGAGLGAPVFSWRENNLNLGDVADVVGFPARTDYGVGIVDADVGWSNPASPPRTRRRFE
jgi:hypothetical protein